MFVKAPKVLVGRPVDLIINISFFWPLAV